MVGTPFCTIPWIGVRGLRLVARSGTDTTSDCGWLAAGALCIIEDEVGDVEEAIPGVSGTVVKGEDDLMVDVDEDRATAD